MPKIRIFPYTLIWALIILSLSVLPHKEGTSQLLSHDKLGHLVFYAIFTLMVYLDNRKQYSQLKHRSKLYIAIIPAIFGFLVELIQGVFLPFRYFDEKDIIANIIGTVVMYLLIRYFNHNK